MAGYPHSASPPRISSSLWLGSLLFDSSIALGSLLFLAVHLGEHSGLEQDGQLVLFIFIFFFHSPLLQAQRKGKIVPQTAQVTLRRAHCTLQHHQDVRLEKEDSSPLNADISEKGHALSGTRIAAWSDSPYSTYRLT